MIYEIINPSDPVTIEADDDKVAAAAVFFLGEGAYGVRSADGRNVLPVLAFAGERAAVEWLEEHGIVENFVSSMRLPIALALQSAIVCRAADRVDLIASVKAGGGDTDAALAAWNETKRTSMNDICGRAHSLARVMRRNGAEAVDA